MQSKTKESNKVKIANLEEKWLNVEPFGKAINMTCILKNELKKFCLSKRINIYLCPFKTPLSSKTITLRNKLSVKKVVKHY